MNNNSRANIIAHPFLKWPGGKRWLVQNYNHLIPRNFGQYIEPFLGGGAVFFHLQPKVATLSDINPELINTYKAIKTDWAYVKRSLQYHQHQHSTNHYYSTRSRQFNDLLKSASRTIYLNRTCFNGIYRVNRNGEFNVPIGSKTNILLDNDNFSRISLLLQKAELFVCDFEESIAKAKKNDLVFADPPYTVRHNLNGFVKYNETLFSWDDQVRLKDSLVAAKKRGAKILLTNANHQSIRNLYSSCGFRFTVVSRYSSIAANGENRTQYEELVISSNTI